MQLLSVLALILAACTDNGTRVTSPVVPSGPNLGATVPFNDQGACLAADVANPANTAGFTNPSLVDPDKSCTSEDVKVATADVLEYSFTGDIGDFTTFDPANPISCIENKPIFLKVRAHLEETATSARSDIGVYIAQDGGNARTGLCNHYNLAPAPTPGSVVDGVSNVDDPSDQCGDMNAGATTNLELGTIDAICQTGESGTLLHIGSCLTWTQPGGDVVCPLPGVAGTNGFRFGTSPGTSSKCNCEGFDVPIVVKKVAKLEVVKACDPTGDDGTFDLLIDGSTSVGTPPVVVGDDKTCGGTTGAQELDAGTSAVPGKVHTHGEGDFTIANYTSSFSCVNRVGGASRGSGTSLGPNNITLQPNDDVVCTYTNVRKPTLTIVKRVKNDNGGTATVDAFGVISSAGSLTFDGGVDDGTDVKKYTSQTFTLATGAYTLRENDVTGYDEGTWSCTDGNLTNNTIGSGSVTLAAGDNAVCTITNDDQGATLKVKKIIINDNGGTKAVGDFGLRIDGNLANFPAGSCSTVSNTTTCLSDGVAVTPGTHTFVELDVAGYTESDWSCSPKSAETVAFDGGSVVTALGDNITCTITNNDDPGHLTIIKHVVNDHGGTKTVGDFGIITSAGALDFTTVPPVDEGGGSTKYTSQTRTVNAGAYTLRENNVAGYTEGTWSCSPTAANPTSITAGSVTVGNGVDVTCEITNNDDPATLIVVKQVKGASTTFPFSSTKSAIGSFDLTPPADGSDSKTFNGLSAGTYDVTEAVPANFVLTDLGCSNDDPATPYDPNATQTVNAVLANGATVTCTFVNEGHTSQTTRTQGFWATHNGVRNSDGTNGLTYIVWFGGTFNGITYNGVTDKYLCVARPIDTLGKLLGGFWSNIAQKTTKKKRSPLDQARMQLAQQLLAAILNNAAFGSSPTGPVSIAQAKAAYCGTNVSAINAAASAMGAFNEGGDSGVFTPGQSANGKLSKTLANLVFWDELP